MVTEYIGLIRHTYCTGFHLTAIRDGLYVMWSVHLNLTVLFCLISHSSLSETQNIETKLIYLKKLEKVWLGNVKNLGLVCFGFFIEFFSRWNLNKNKIPRKSIARIALSNLKQKLFDLGFVNIYFLLELRTYVHMHGGECMFFVFFFMHANNIKTQVISKILLLSKIIAVIVFCDVTSTCLVLESMLNCTIPLYFWERVGWTIIASTWKE